jgi:hypothetical protein
MIRVALLLLLAATGCSPAAKWSAPVTVADRVPLSLARAGKQTFAVGGALGSGGEALFLRFDGYWHSVPTGTQATLWWVFGFSESDVYAVGDQGTVARWNGSQLALATTPTTLTLYGVWGAAPNDLYAVGGMPGSSGVALHYDGSSWSQLPPLILGPTGALFKVWGSAADDVFVCGEGGLVIHWDGSAWTSQPTGLAPSVTLFTVAGRARDDVYAVGGLGRAAAIHYDGRAWSPFMDAAFDAVGGLAGVSVDTDGSVLIVGGGGIKLRGKPGALADETLEQPNDDLHAALLVGGEGFVVGGSYVAPAPAPRRGVVGHYGGSISSTRIAE